MSSSPLTSRQADRSWERAPGAASSELPWLAGLWLLVCINQPAEGTGRWQRGHNPACCSAGLSGQCRTTPPLPALLARTPLAVATVLDGDAPRGRPRPSGAWAPCQGRISGRGPYPLFWVSRPHAAHLPVKRGAKHPTYLTALPGKGELETPPASAGRQPRRWLRGLSTLLVSFHFDICVQPWVVRCSYNSRGGY